MDSETTRKSATDRATQAAEPARHSEAVQGLWALVAEGKMTWGGGKPVGANVPYRGPEMSGVISEDRG